MILVSSHVFEGEKKKLGVHKKVESEASAKKAKPSSVSLTSN